MPVGIEWIVLGVVVVLLLVLGPKKIPDLARKFGEAVAEFRKARREDREV